MWLSKKISKLFLFSERKCFFRYYYHHLFITQGAEFDVYGKYASDVLRQECADQLMDVVNQPPVSDALTSAGQGFKEAVKYYLPKLLLVPVCHVFTYFKYIEVSRFVMNMSEDCDALYLGSLNGLI